MPSPAANPLPNMTTYGTIPTSSPPVNLDSISRAKERLKASLGERRPWREMFEFHHFRLPKSFSDAGARIRLNTAYFLMNYAIVVLLILFLSLLWHPISLVACVAMMAAWLFLYFLRYEPLVVFGRTITDRVVLVLLSVVTLAVLLVTRATSNIVAALSLGVVVVAIHGAMRKADDLCFDQEAVRGKYENRRLSSSGGPSSSA